MFSLIYYVFFSVPLSVTFTIIGTISLTVFVYIQSVISNCNKPARLYHSNSTLDQYVIKRVRRLVMPFKPPFWARNAHLQTIIPLFLPKVEFHFEREYLLMKDKGIIALDWGITGTSKLGMRSPVMVILPGLTGDCTGLGFFCRRAVMKGFRPIVFNKRGYGDTPLTTSRLQSFGDPSDMREVVKYLRSCFHHTRIVSVSMSCGAGLLMSYLGEYGHSSYVSAAVCVSPGYDAGSLFVKPHAIGFLYEFYLLWRLKKIICRHAPALSKVLDVQSVLRARTLRQFDELVFCRLSNCSLSEYWEKNEPLRDVDDVATPVLCINSADDPICKKRTVPFELFNIYPNLMLAYTEKGGHCGFIDGVKYESWSDKLAIDYCQAVLEFLDKTEYR